MMGCSVEVHAVGGRFWGIFKRHTARLDRNKGTTLGRKKKRKPPKIVTDLQRKDVLLADNRTADAATVGWTLAAMATLGALALRWLVQLMINSTADPKSLPEATPFIPGLMLFSALISGILAVSATPLVYWLRRSSPPWQITAAVMVIGLTPLALLIMNW